MIMIRIFKLLLVTVLASCKSNRVIAYERIVSEGEKFETIYKPANKIVTIPQQQVADFKKVLIRNVRPELQHSFINDVRVDIYRNSKRIAFLMIDNNSANPFVNFCSDDLNFGFRLTYGIGQTIDNLYTQPGL